MTIQNPLLKVRSSNDLKFSRCEKFIVNSTLEMSSAMVESVLYSRRYKMNYEIDTCCTRYSLGINNPLGFFPTTTCLFQPSRLLIRGEAPHLWHFGINMENLIAHKTFLIYKMLDFLFLMVFLYIYIKNNEIGSNFDK